MKVIIWGHKLYSHTHSFIHYGFHKAFKAMGYETYWFDNNDDVSTFDFSNCLFLTENQVCKNMPARKDCKYILHNVRDHDVLGMDVTKVGMQVYNKSWPKGEVGVECLNDYTLVNNGKTVIQPWATDLLPEEIKLDDIPKESSINYIGSVTIGWNNVFNECLEFAKSAKKKNINFVISGGYTGNVKNYDLLKCKAGFVSIEDSIKLIKKSYCAPIFQSVEQREMKYIPCRIFKNISYGQYPVTNCEHLQFLFPGKVIYNDDPQQLFFDFEERKNNEILKELMNEVKEKHTYINRINTLMDLL